MSKYHGQRDKHDGDPHTECIDVRREKLWMHELPTQPFFSTPIVRLLLLLDFSLYYSSYLKGLEPTLYHK